MGYDQRKLAEYVKEQRESRLWSQRELGRQAGISYSSVQRAEDPFPDHPVSWDACAAIAKAFRVPILTMFHLADLVEREPPQTTWTRELTRIYSQLGEEHQQMLLHFAYYLFTQRSNLFPRMDELPAEDDGDA